MGMGHEIDKTEKEGDGTFYGWPEMSQKTRLKFFLSHLSLWRKENILPKNEKNIKTTAREADRTVALWVLRTAFVRPECRLHFRTTAEFILSRCRSPGSWPLWRGIHPINLTNHNASTIWETKYAWHRTNLYSCKCPNKTCSICLLHEQNSCN